MKNLLKLTIISLSILAISQSKAAGIEYPSACMKQCPTQNFASWNAQLNCLNNCLNNYGPVALQ